MSCRSISYCQSQQKVKSCQGFPQRSKISGNGMSLQGEGEGGLRERENSLVGDVAKEHGGIMVYEYY